MVDNDEIITTLYSGDDFVYIWLLGDGSIGLCDPQTMVYTLVQNFFGGQNDSVIPLSAVASTKISKILGLYLHADALKFVYLYGEDPMIRKTQQEVIQNSKTIDRSVLPKITKKTKKINKKFFQFFGFLTFLGGTVLCLDTSFNEEIVFCGGSTSYTVAQGVAIVFAISFDSDLSYITEIQLPNNLVRTMGVSSMKRMKDRDVLFCGTNAAVFVVEWTGTHFEILSQVETIHSCKKTAFKD